MNSLHETLQAGPACLKGARLPRWMLPPDWPVAERCVALADIFIDEGRIADVRPHDSHLSGVTVADLQGMPVLPGLVDAHTHLDKTFTRARLGSFAPGLLAAIAAMGADKARWTVEDLQVRAGRALEWAEAAGVTRLRTHCDWWVPDAAPLSWPVLREVAESWRGRMMVERVSLIPLPFFAQREAAQQLARTVAESGPGARLGAFIHTSNYDRKAVLHVLEAAQDFGLDLDLHIDEELDPRAEGLRTVAGQAERLGFAGRIVCGHACALSAQEEQVVQATLDTVARAPITLVSLPVTNLLLQDAQTGRTPRQRGLTLIKEIHARGIPLLIASDNVQDAFCAVGSYDPVEALMAGVLAGQLDDAFDVWSETICRAGWLDREAGGSLLTVGQSADLVIFPGADAWSWPARSQSRRVLRAGKLLMPSGGVC